MNTLKITHDAGFFSCCSKRLEGIVGFFNTYKRLPDIIDSTEQFSLYKGDFVGDPIALYFREQGIAIPYTTPVSFHNDMQFLPYKDIAVDMLQPFIEKYFSPTQQVHDAVSSYERKYGLNYSHTCAVYYRGNDKSIETAIAPYEIFIAQARHVKKEHPAVTFLVQTDESEFLAAFMQEFPESISFDEIRPMSKKQSFVAAELPPDEQVSHGIHFLASVIVLSKCEWIVTHSGNGALWCILYRGNTINVFQWINGSWNHPRVRFSMLWQKYKKHIKRLLGMQPGWTVSQTS